MASSVKVTTYNVLSSHLSDAKHFQACSPEYLDPAYRLKLVKEKLQAEVDSNAIICLQEVSHLWAGELHPFFANQSYHLITGLYGAKFNGYMGVAVAVPMKKYEIVDSDVKRIVDTKLFQPKPVRRGFVQNLFLKFFKIFWEIGLKVGLVRDKIDMWDSALYRTNQMVSVRLREKGENATSSNTPSTPTDTTGTGSEVVMTAPPQLNRSFVVGTYHMPCMFKLPSVMVTHCALSAQHIQAWAKGDPYVYCGDFNIKPNTSQYDILTKGTLSKDHPDYPEQMEGDSWVAEVKPPLKSAYLEKNGVEPDFTNYAKVQQDPIFIETLDYIFHSDDWKVDSVRELPHRDLVAGPLPNKEEPSDHILISAELSLKKKEE